MVFSIGGLKFHLHRLTLFFFNFNCDIRVFSRYYCNKSNNPSSNSDSFVYIVCNSCLLCLLEQVDEYSLRTHLLQLKQAQRNGVPPMLGNHTWLLTTLPLPAWGGWQKTLPQCRVLASVYWEFSLTFFVLCFYFFTLDRICKLFIFLFFFSLTGPGCFYIMSKCIYVLYI